MKQLNRDEVRINLLLISRMCIGPFFVDTIRISNSNNQLTLKFHRDIMEVKDNTIRNQGFIEFLPVSLFGSVLGLSGLCFAWRLACKHWHLNEMISESIGMITVLSFAALTIAYLIKWRRYPLSVRQEIENPISITFFATFIVSMLLIPGILLPYLPVLAIVMWTTGTFSMFFFAWYVFRKWIDSQQLTENAAPAWVLPIVGTLDVPIVGTRLHLPGIREACLLFFAIGIIFALILMTVIISRLIFQKPLPQAAQPTLLILIAPFALAFLCYENLTEKQDILAAVFFYFDLFLLLLMGSKIAYLPVSCPFRMTWWSVSFPLTAITITAFRYNENKPDTIHELLAGLLLAVSSLVILFLLIQSVFRIAKGTFNSTLIPVTSIAAR